MREPRRALAPALGAALLFAVLTPWVLRPWFLADDVLPRAHGPQAALLDADTYLNVWILAWIAHAAVAAPAHLFDGNIYFPAPNTIAGSEHMLAHLPVTAPVMAATGDALLVLKAMALESFVLAGLAMFAFVFHHTRDPLAALVAGAAYTFAPWRPGTIPQPQYLGTQYLPLALLGVDCWLAGRRPRALVGLAAALALQALACFYLGYFAFVAVPVYAAARLWLDRPPARGRAALGLVGAAGLGALLVVPAALPYLAARSLRTIPSYDPRELMAQSGALSVDALRYATLHAYGLAPVAFVIAALLLARRRGAGERAPHGATWVLAGAAFVLSLGPYLRLGDALLPLPYLLPYWLVPGFASMRGPVRFFVVIGAALAALAGFLFARWTAGRGGALRAGVAAALVAGCVLGAAPIPAPTMPAPLGRRASPAHRWLAAQPAGGAVLDVPASLVNGDFLGQLLAGRHMVASTLHWHPLVDGYTAYPPPTTEFFAAIVAALPDPDALALLVDTADVRWLVVHGAELTPRERRRWAEAPDLAVAARFGLEVVYAVRRAPERAWRGEIWPRAVAPAPDTLAGTPTAPLPAACRRGRILAVETTPLVPAPSPVAVRVQVENPTACAWPALGVRADGLVGLSYRWVDASGRVHPPGPFARFLADVPPGTVAATRLLVFPPDAVGRWRLEVSLVQDGLADPLASVTADVEVQPFRTAPVRPSA